LKENDPGSVPITVDSTQSIVGGEVSMPSRQSPSTDGVDGRGKRRRTLTLNHQSRNAPGQNHRLGGRSGGGIRLLAMEKFTLGWVERG